MVAESGDVVDIRECRRAVYKTGFGTRREEDVCGQQGLQFHTDMQFIESRIGCNDAEKSAR